MAGKFNIVGTLAVLAFGLDIGAGIAQAKADDGKISTADIGKFLPALMDLPPAIEGVRTLPAELGDLDQAELEQIRAFVVEKLKNVPGVETKWVQLANGAITVGLGALQIMEALKSEPVAA